MMMRSKRLVYRIVTERSRSTATTETLLYRRGGGVINKVADSNIKWISTIVQSSDCRQNHQHHHLQQQQQQQQQQHDPIHSWNHNSLPEVPSITTIWDNCNGGRKNLGQGRAKKYEKSYGQ